MDDLPIGPVEFDSTGIVQDGLVRTLSWVITPDSQAELDAAFLKLANEDLVSRWLYHWDTVEGEQEGIEEVLAEDFVSHYMPAADKAGMIAGVEGFRSDNPGAYFPVDELYVTEDKAFLINRMWMVPEGETVKDNADPGSTPYLLVLGIEDGKMTERRLYVTPE